MFFSEEKAAPALREQKDFYSLRRFPVPGVGRHVCAGARITKVFCFFFSKKKSFLLP
jgi:hypothetical protein